MSSGDILKGFNDHFSEFLDDINRVFPTNSDILKAKTAINMIRKANPKMLIMAWQTFIVDKYSDVIEKGDITFFIDKDYSDDIDKFSSSNQDKTNSILDTINKLRGPVRDMKSDEQQKAMQYIQNLCQLSNAYKTM
jgi:hypothetical protein